MTFLHAVRFPLLAVAVFLVSGFGYIAASGQTEQFHVWRQQVVGWVGGMGTSNYNNATSTMTFQTPFQITTSEELTALSAAGNFTYDIADDNNAVIVFTFTQPDTGVTDTVRVTSVSELLEVIPHFRNPDEQWVMVFAWLVNQLTHGIDYELIDNPAAFAEAYRAAYAAEDPNEEVVPGQNRLRNFGMADLAAITIPTFSNNTLTFYAENAYLGYPYRVTYRVDGVPEYEPVGVVADESDTHSQPMPASFPFETEAEWLAAQSQVTIEYIQDEVTKLPRLVFTDTRTGTEVVVTSHKGLYQVLSFIQNDIPVQSETLALFAKLATYLTYSNSYVVITEQPTNFDLLQWMANDKTRKQQLLDSFHRGPGPHTGESPSAPAAQQSAGDIDRSRLEREIDFSVVTVPTVTYPIISWYVQPPAGATALNIPFKIRFGIPNASFETEHLVW